VRVLAIVCVFAAASCRKEPDRSNAHALESFVEHELRKDAAPAVDIVKPDLGEPPADMAVIDVGGERFYLDRTEVSIGAYQECVNAGACLALEDLPQACSELDETNDQRLADQRPVRCMTPPVAWMYCHYRGKRLPTAAEWQRAAIGRGTIYPWGKQPITCTRAVVSGRDDHCSGFTAPVGSRPTGASPDGVLDLVGNVAEIVSGIQLDGRYELDAHWGTLGGSVDTDAKDVPRALREIDTRQDANIGFRCMRLPTKP
jgi:eukaryotic-like serine/threonine-protein kinase